VFLNNLVSEKIRFTFLQIVFLLIEVQDSLTAFKASETLLQFITQSIEMVSKDSANPHNPTKTIEEAIVLLIT